MSYTRDDDPLRDEEYPNAEDSGDAEQVGLIRCVSCKREIAEDSVQCPYCKTWEPDVDVPWSVVLRGVFKAIVVFVLIAVILVMWHGLGR